MRMIPLVFSLIIVLFSLGYASAYSYNDTLLNDSILIVTSSKSIYPIESDGNYFILVELENTSGTTNYADIDFEIYVEKEHSSNFKVIDILQEQYVYGPVPYRYQVMCKKIVLQGEKYICEENSYTCQSDKICDWIETEYYDDWHYEWGAYSPSNQLFSGGDIEISSKFESVREYRNFSINANSSKKFKLVVSPKKKITQNIEFIVVAKSVSRPEIKSVLDPEFGTFHQIDDFEDNWGDWVGGVVALTGIQETTIITEGTSSVNLRVDVNSEHANEGSWSNVSLGPFDISDTFGTSSGNPVDGTITFDLFVSNDLSDIHILTIEMGNEPGRATKYNILASAVEGDWNNIVIDATKFQSTAGTPDWTDVTYVRLNPQWLETTPDFNIYFDDFYVGLKTPTTVVDINVSHPQNNEIFDTKFVSSIDINIDVSSQFNTLLIDLNYSPSRTQGTGTVIIDDMNTTGESITCDDSDFSDSTNCIFVWNISGVSDGNYFILTEAFTQTGVSHFGAGNRDFNIWTSDAFTIDINWAFPSPLTIFDPDESVSSIDVDVNDFSICNSCTIDDWNWYIDSVLESTDQNITLTFTSYADYNISLSVSSTDGGEIRDQLDMNFHFLQFPQGLDINYAPSFPVVTAVVDLNSMYDQPPTITNVSWIIPDPDTNTTDFNTTHTFNSAGTKNVCFIATNDFDLNKLYCEEINIFGSYILTFRQEDRANNFPTLSVAGDGLAVTIDGNNFSGDISAQGVLALSKQTLPTGRYTLLASATDMTERTFILDLNSELDIDLNLLLVDDSNASSASFTFFKPNDSDKFADANVTLQYFRLPTYWSGRITLDSDGIGSFFMNGADTNYAFDIQDGDTNFLYIGTDVNVLPPKRADTGQDINSLFSVSVTGIAASNHNELSKATVIHIYSDTTSPYSFTIDSNADFIETTLLVQPTGGDTNLTIQPFLNPVADVLGTTFRAVRKSDQTAIQGVTIEIFQSIGGGDEIVASGTTDIKGEFLAFLIVNQAYLLTITDVNGSISLDKEPYLQTSTTLIFIQLGSLGLDVIDVPRSISVLFTPGFESFNNSGLTFSQRFSSDRDFNTLDVNYFNVIVTTSIAGADVNVFDVNLLKDVNWLGTATSFSHSMTLGTDFEIADNNRFTIKTFIFFNDGTVSINAKSYYSRSTASWMDIARGEFRLEMGCPADDSACPTTIMLSILISIIFTALAVMRIGTLQNPRAGSILFMGFIALFTYLNWIPLILTAIMTIAVLFIFSASRN